MTFHSGPVLAERANLTAIDCRMCGFAHLWPLPSLGAAFYESAFWQTYKAGAVRGGDMQTELLTVFFACLFLIAGGIIMYILLRRLERWSREHPYVEDTPEERRKKMYEDYSKWRY